MSKRIFSGGKNRKNIVSLLPGELAQSVVKVIGEWLIMGSTV